MADPELRRGDSGPSVVEAQNLLNRDGAMLDPLGNFGSVTESVVLDFQDRNGITETGIIDAATWAKLRALPDPSPDVPIAALKLIVTAEVGSREEYLQRYMSPVWPGGDSGITIGVGYDIGQETKDFARDWGPVLPPSQVSALRPWVGKQGPPAQLGVAALGGVIIPWNPAWIVFIESSIPAYVVKTANAFPSTTKLSPLCFGALVSLVYNRGDGMVDSPPGSGNRKEMRDIRDALAAGRPQDVPAALRAMKRLWPNARGLRDRRDAEADLFEQGLTSPSVGG